MSTRSLPSPSCGGGFAVSGANAAACAWARARARAPCLEDQAVQDVRDVLHGPLDQRPEAGEPELELPREIVVVATEEESEQGQDKVDGVDQALHHEVHDHPDAVQGDLQALQLAARAVLGVLHGRLVEGLLRATAGAHGPQRGVGVVQLVEVLHHEAGEVVVDRREGRWRVDKAVVDAVPRGEAVGVDDHLPRLLQGPADGVHAVVQVAQVDPHGHVVEEGAVGPDLPLAGLHAQGRVEPLLPGYLAVAAVGPWVAEDPARVRAVPQQGLVRAGRCLHGLGQRGHGRPRDRFAQQPLGALEEVVDEGLDLPLVRALQQRAGRRALVARPAGRPQHVLGEHPARGEGWHERRRRLAGRAKRGGGNTYLDGDHRKGRP